MLKKKFISTFTGHTNWVRCARFSHDSNLIASASDDKCIKLFDRKSGNCIHTYNDLKGEIEKYVW